MELNRRAPSGDLRINQPRRLHGRRVRLVSLRAAMWAGAAAVATIACLSAEAQAQQAQQYIKADGSKTNDLEAAAQSWRDDPEFLNNWGLGAIRAEDAYAKGLTGKGLKVGVFDTGAYGKHPEFTGKLTGLHTEGIYAYTYKKYYKKGDHLLSFDGDDPLHGIGLAKTHNHGTHVAGIIAAKRDGKTMHGVAFDAPLLAGHHE